MGRILVYEAFDVRVFASRSCVGKEIITVEGLAEEPEFDVVREAFSRNHALQCGFCTPGFLATIAEMMDEGVLPQNNVIRDRLAGNLCRCTGYQNIVRAAQEVLANSKGRGIGE